MQGQNGFCIEHQQQIVKLKRPIKILYIIDFWPASRITNSTNVCNTPTSGETLAENVPMQYRQNLTLRKHQEAKEPLAVRLTSAHVLHGSGTLPLP